MNKMAYIKLKFIIALKRSNRRHRGVVAKNRNIIRHCFDLHWLCMKKNDVLEFKAKKIIADALAKGPNIVAFFEPLHKLNEMVVFMQHKFQNRFIIKAARIAVLSHYWDLKLTKLYNDSHS